MPLAKGVAMMLLTRNLLVFGFLISVNAMGIAEEFSSALFWIHHQDGARLEGHSMITQDDSEFAQLTAYMRCEKHDILYLFIPEDYSRGFRLPPSSAITVDVSFDKRNLIALDGLVITEKRIAVSYKRLGFEMAKRQIMRVFLIDDLVDREIVSFVFDLRSFGTRFSDCR